MATEVSASVALTVMGMSWFRGTAWVGRAAMATVGGVPSILKVRMARLVCPAASVAVAWNV